MTEKFLRKLISNHVLDTRKYRYYLDMFCGVCRVPLKFANSPNRYLYCEYLYDNAYDKLEEFRKKSFDDFNKQLIREREKRIALKNVKV